MTQMRTQTISDQRPAGDRTRHTHTRHSYTSYLDVVKIKESAVTLHQIVRAVAIEDAAAQVLPPARVERRRSTRLQHSPLLRRLHEL